MLRFMVEIVALFLIAYGGAVLIGGFILETMDKPYSIACDDHSDDASGGGDAEGGDEA